MGQATDALLAYGYDLGGPSDEWHVRETGSYGLLDVPWWDQEQDDPSFLEAAQARIAEAGITGVEIHTHCSRDYPEYLLTAHCTTAHRGYPQHVAPIFMSVSVAGAGDRLTAALKALGLTPTRDLPGWILASYAEL